MSRLYSVSFLIVVSVSLAACAGDPSADARAHVASGDRYVSAGKFAEAIIEYRNALKGDPKSGETRYKLAEAYSKSSEPMKAFQEYLRAADLMPQNRETQLKAAGGLLLAGRFEEVKDRVEAFLAKSPRDGQALLLLANALAGLKDLDSALAQVEEAITLDPTEPRRHAVLGTIYMARRDAQRAEAAFRKALELKPDDVAVLLALGNFYWASGRVADAEEAFLRAYRHAPESLSPNRALATLYASTQRMPDAEPFLKRAVALSPTFRPQLALADYYVSLKRPADAARILEGLLKLPEAVSEARARLAAIDYTAGRTREAFARLNEILRDDPKNVRARLLKVRLLVDSRQYDEAAATAAQTLEIDPTSAAAHYTHGALLEARGDRRGARRAYLEVLRLNPRAIQAQLRLSEISLQEGTLDLAVQFAAEALKDEPVNDEARMKLARALLARRDVVGAEKEIKILVARYGNSAAVQTLAGLLRTQQGDYVAARGAFSRALAVKPRSPEALDGLLTVDAATNNLEESRARIAQSLSARPDDPELLLVAAKTAILRRDWDEAERTLRRVVAVDASNLTAYVMLGTAYANQGKLDEARREFEQIAHHDPTSVAAPTMVAVLLHTQNRLKETREWYERVLRLDPGAAVAANNLAWIEAETNGDLQQALQLAEMAASRLPNRPEVNDTLGWVRYRRGEYAEAIAPLTRSVEEDPSNPLYLYHLGLAQAGNGQKEAAQETLRQALALRRDFEGAGNARRLLESR